MSDEEVNRLIEEAKKRPKLSGLYSDFMDALSDYGCGLYTNAEFRKILEDIHNRYKHYPTTEIMYKATIQRLTSCCRVSEEKDTNWQCKWANEELDLVKRPPKIIF